MPNVLSWIRKAAPLHNRTLLMDGTAASFAKFGGDGPSCFAPAITSVVREHADWFRRAGTRLPPGAAFFQTRYPLLQWIGASLRDAVFFAQVTQHPKLFGLSAAQVPLLLGPATRTSGPYQ